MADEDITLDGKPLQSLRVADLKAALEQRNLSKNGQKNALVKRLKGALMLENLHKSSASHSGLQPNSQIGEEMSQNSFIKQYLAKQQELLRQRLEREAQQDDEDDESSAVADDDDRSDDDSSSSSSGKNQLMRTEEGGEERGGDSLVSHGVTACDPNVRRTAVPKQRVSSEAPGNGTQRATFPLGLQEPPAPSPPRAVASLSVRVLGQPDRQGLPPQVPRAQEKEGTAPSEPGSACPVLHLSRSAGARAHEDSGEDDDGDDESDDDEDWGPGPGRVRKARKVPPQLLPPSVPSANARSKRKLQPPQHIPPPPQVHQNPIQLRHPTPPPSPPPELSFPLPDTPKQSPPDTDDPDGEDGGGGGQGMASFSPPTMQRRDSDSSCHSSSPDPPPKRKRGPLSLLAHKMEAEGAFRAAEPDSVTEEMAHSTTGTADSQASPPQKVDTGTQEEDGDEEKERKLPEEDEKRGPKEELGKQKRCQEDEETGEVHRLENKRQEETDKLEGNGDDAGTVQPSHTRKSTVNPSEPETSVLQDVSPGRPAAGTRTKDKAAAAQDKGSSSDSDSSSSSSQSSSSKAKFLPAGQLKKDDGGPKVEEDKRAGARKVEQKPLLPKREVSEPSAAAVTEVEPDSEGSAAQQSSSGPEPDNSEVHLEESTTPKAFATRKISLTSSKISPAATEGGAGDSEAASTAAAGRKRRWGSSTAVTAKKPSISITTDSLKSLIPDIKASQEAVVELHPEEFQLSGDEENLDPSRDDQDKGLKIRRTVTQVVPGDSQENGQQNEEEEVEKPEGEKQEKQRRASKDKRKNSHSEDVSETQTPVKVDTEVKKVTPSDSVVRRSISQQKSGVSVTIDDPVRAARQLSPPRGKVSTIIHVTNLVRPFTLVQLKELLNRTGAVLEEGFWIDKIKSHCYVTYASTEEAVATRAALHGVKWPQSNPKVLSVDFCEQDELDFHKGIIKPNKEEELVVLPALPPNRLPPLMPERDRERDRDRERERERDREREREREIERDRGAVPGVRDQWAERERAMERRERARGEREWDRDKIREFARPGEEKPRSRSRDRERRRRERAKSKERKTEKKEKPEEPPAKLLDDLFLKTKAAPCIYWLPLTEEQVAQKLLDRVERQKERERKRKEGQEEEQKRQEQEKKDRLKVREKDAAGAAASNSGSTAAATATTRVADADRERERGRDREGDRRRDGHRPRRASPTAGGGRRSRSRSNPRDRRR